MFLDGFSDAATRSGSGLGNHANIVSPPAKPSKLWSAPAAPFNKILHRQKRFKLQNIAAKLAPSLRVSKCLRVVSSRLAGVDLHYSASHKSGFYSGLQTCSSVWCCPVCSAKIGARRREELHQAVEIAESKNLRVLLLTLTIRHHSKQSLDLLLCRLKQAYRYFWSGAPGQRLAAEVKLHGHINTTEVTHGVNGWHPHLHVLLFLSPLPNDGGSAGSVRRAMARFSHLFKLRWQRCVKRAGVDASYNVGADLQAGGAHLARYFTKISEQFGIEYEMASTSKTTRAEGGQTPNDLLGQVATGDELVAEQAAKLWQEYANTTFRMKWITWSNGLRSFLGIVQPEKTDEELAQEKTEDATKIINLSLREWQNVLDDNLRSELLDTIEDAVSNNNMMKLYLYLFSSGIIDAWRLDVLVSSMEELT